ncbi:transcription termination/antitermination protein NusG [Alsobacter sp. R-9]
MFTAPRQEERARLNLERQGFSPFLPQIDRSVRHARRISTVRSALFPRYLFVSLDLGVERWLSIRGTFGVSSLYMAGGLPAPVPHGVVESLQASLGNTGSINLDSGLEVGSEVRVLRGPFTDLVGILSRLDDNGRVRVLLDIMGTRTPVTLPRNALMPA